MNYLSLLERQHKPLNPLNVLERGGVQVINDCSLHIPDLEYVRFDNFNKRKCVFESLTTWEYTCRLLHMTCEEICVLQKIIIDQFLLCRNSFLWIIEKIKKNILVAHVSGSQDVNFQLGYNSCQLSAIFFSCIMLQALKNVLSIIFAPQLSIKHRNFILN